VLSDISSNLTIAINLFLIFNTYLITNGRVYIGPKSTGNGHLRL